jgi:hypothetical protein
LEEAAQLIPEGSMLIGDSFFIMDQEGRVASEDPVTLGAYFCMAASD